MYPTFFPVYIVDSFGLVNSSLYLSVTFCSFFHVSSYTEDIKSCHFALLVLPVFLKKGKKETKQTFFSKYSNAR